MKKIMFIFTFVFIILFSVACTKKVEVEKIELDQGNELLELEVSDIDLSIFNITVTYSDDSTKKVDLDKNMMSEVDYAKLSTVGTHTITIIYSEKSLKATFTIYENVKVTFEADGGTITGDSSITIRKGTKIKNLPTATKAEVSFLGWKQADGSAFTTDTIVNGNIIVTANWNIAKAYEFDSTTIPASTLVGEFDISDLKIIVTYTDDTTSKISVTQDMLSTEDYAKLSTAGTHSITVNYFGEQDLITIVIYENVTVTFNPDGGTLVGEASVIVKKGTKLTALPTVTKDDLGFLGWKQADGTAFTLDTIVTANITVTADWNTVKAVAADSTTIPNEILLADFSLANIKLILTYKDNKTETITLTKSMMSAADFAKLSTSGNHTITINYLDKTFNININIYENVTVRFNPDGGVLVGETSIIVKTGTKLTALPTVTKDDLELLGWKQADGTAFTLDTVVTGNLTITAIWNAIKTISIDSTTVPAEVSMGNLHLNNIKIVIQYENNTYKSISVTEEMLSEIDLDKLFTTGTHELTINYLNQALNIEITIYENVSILFCIEGKLSTKDIRKGSPIGVLPILQKPGYDFLGWFINDELVNSQTIINANSAIVAQFEEDFTDTTAAFTYHSIDNLQVSKIKYGIVISDSGELYIPNPEFTVLNKITNQEDMVYYSFTDLYGELILEADEVVVDILYYDEFNSGELILKTNHNNYYGFFRSNSAGQYGRGYSYDIIQGIHKLYENIPFNVDEEIVTTYVNGSYNIAITNQNRVFLTGGIHFEGDNEYYFISKTPVNITDQFNLDSDEYFESFDNIIKNIGVFSSKVITTNKRIFGLTGLFSDSEANDNIFIDLSEVFGEKVIFAYGEENEDSYTVITASGKIFITDEITPLQLPLDVNGTITDISFHSMMLNMLFITTSNNNKMLIDLESLEELPIIARIPETVGEIEGLYFNEYYMFITNTDGDIYYIIGKEFSDTEDLQFYQLNDVLDVEIKFDYNNFNMYFVVDNEVHLFINDVLEKLSIPYTNTRTEFIQLGTHVSLPLSDNNYYYIEGWENGAGEAVVKVIAEYNVEFYQSIATLYKINILSGLGNDNIFFDTNYVMELDFYTQEKFNATLIAYFEENGIEYGDINNYVLQYFNGDKYDFLLPVITDQILEVVLDQENSPKIFVTYYDIDGNIVGTNNVLAIKGSTVDNDLIDYNFDAKYEISKYYTDYSNQIEFDIHTIITENLFLDIVLTKKESFTLSIKLPDGLADLVYPIYMNSELPNRVFDNLFYISNNYGYNFNGLFLDPEFTNEFNVDFHDFSSDLVLYAKLIKEESTNVYIRYFLLDQELTLYNKIQKLYLGDEYEFTLHIPYQFYFMGAFLDDQMTVQIEEYNDLDITVIYVKLDYENGNNYNLDIVFPQFNNTIYQVNGYYNSSVFGNNLDKYISQLTGLYFAGHQIFADEAMEVPIENPANTYETIYIHINGDPFYNTTINLGLDEVESLVFYLPLGMGLDNSLILERLNNSNIYEYSDISLYTDESKSIPFDYQYDSYIDGLVLYADVVRNELLTVNVEIQSGITLELLVGKNISKESLVNTIEVNVNNLGDEYLARFILKLYTDEAYTTEYALETLTEDIVLYGKLIPREKVKSNIIFIDESYETIEFVYYLNYELDNYHIFDIIGSNYYLSVDEYILYLDLELTERFTESILMTESINLYVKLNKRINIAFPFTRFFNEYICLEDGEVLDKHMIEALLESYDSEYIYNVSIYLDSKMTIPFVDQELTHGDYVYVSYEKSLGYTIGFSYYMYYDGYYGGYYYDSVEVSGIVSLAEINAIIDNWIINYYVSSDKCEIEGIYYDEELTQIMDQDIESNIELYIRIDEYVII